LGVFSAEGMQVVKEKKKKQNVLPTPGGKQDWLFRKREGGGTS